MMGRAKSFYYGFTIGGVAAGISVLLNTPKSGKQMRKDLKNSLSDFTESVDDIKIAIAQARSNLNDLKTNGLPLVRSTVHDIKGAVEIWRTDVQPYISRIIQDSKKLSEETRHISLPKDQADQNEA